ncbi:MAG: hypothetical protein Q9207_008266 [Kuettlingeria erythrocarpa]
MSPLKMGSGKVIMSGHTSVENLPQQARLQESERSLRLRNNKRRYRARQKEYTTELERKLRELQQEGIRATIEVQQSARKVVHENERLKELLRHVGVGEETIYQCVSGEKKGGDDHDDEPDCPRKRACSRRVAAGTGVQANIMIGDSQGEGYQACEVVTTASSPPLEHEQVYLSHPAQLNPRDSKSAVGDGVLPIANETPTPASDKSPVNNVPPSSGTCRGSGDSETSSRCRRSSSAGTSSAGNSSASHPPAPCKLLTHLAANPSADITQMPTALDEKGLDPKDTNDGISCSNAYRMLMHYATTESKLDAVAHILEEGCVPTRNLQRFAALLPNYIRFYLQDASRDQSANWFSEPRPLPEKI